MKVLKYFLIRLRAVFASYNYLYSYSKLFCLTCLLMQCCSTSQINFIYIIIFFITVYNPVYWMFLKKYSILKIDQHLAHYFENYGLNLSSPPHFLFSQIITSFLNSMIPTNQETGL